MQFQHHSSMFHPITGKYSRACLQLGSGGASVTGSPGYKQKKVLTGSLGVNYVTKKR
jgi:hypothetical protein